MTTTFLAVRLGKAVATTATLMMFTMQFNDHEPNFPFIILTVFYFALTQFPEKRPDVLTSSVTYQRGPEVNAGTFPGMNFSLGPRSPDWDEIKELWLPVLVKFSAVIMSGVMMVLSWRKHPWICSIGVYTNIISPFVELYHVYVFPLEERTRVLSGFRLANKSDLLVNDDDVCPICLDPMSKMARVTPCNHMFHGNCLYRCLKVTNLCPKCKRCIVLSSPRVG
jgi:hypothetical protein